MVGQVVNYKFEQRGDTYFVLVLKAEKRLRNGFRFIKDLLLQGYNVKLMDAHDRMTNAGVEIQPVKTDCFTIPADCEAKAREAAAEVDAAGEAVEQAARSTLDDVAQPVPKGQEAAAVSDAGKGAKKPPRKRVSKAAISAEAGAPSGAEAGSVRKRAPRAARKPAEST